MKERDVSFLNQLTHSLEETTARLEDAYEKKDYESFNKSKKMIMQIQEKISEVING